MQLTQYVPSQEASQKYKTCLLNSFHSVDNCGVLGKIHYFFKLKNVCYRISALHIIYYFCSEGRNMVRKVGNIMIQRYVYVRKTILKF
jgi:hypothetical protein